MGRDGIEGGEIFLSSSEEMRELGRRIGSFLPSHSILALSGDLGAGKTTFVQGIAQGLGIDAPIQSPTFIYLNQYQGILPLFHFDLYRIKGVEDFIGMGFDEYFAAEGVCVLEWPERIFPILPERAVRILFSHQEKGRILSFSEKLIGLS